MFVSGYARFVSMRLAEGRRPEGRDGAWRRSRPLPLRSKCGTKQPVDLQAYAMPRPFSGGTPLGKAAAVRGLRR